MVQAAVRGAVDYSRARLRDPRWWRKLNIVLDEIENENLRFQATTLLNYSGALIGSSRLADDSWDKHAKQIERHLDIVLATFNPSYEIDPEKRKKQQVKALEGAWIEVFGDPDDPAIKDKIDATAEAILAMAAAGRAKK